MHRRSSLVYPVTHLPLLHNPMLNAIFNHPNPSRSRLNKITKLLSENPGQFIIILPDARSLASHVELCHDEMFVQSHIVQEISKNVYTSLNNRNYNVSKNFIVLPGTELKVEMLRNDFFFNFNNYMSGNCLYKIIHIESPLELSLGGASKSAPAEEDMNAEVDFNQLIREFPLISERIGETYRNFFTRLNLKDINTIPQLIESFNSVIGSGSSIFIDNLDKESISGILQKYPNLDINKSLFNYIEMNIYDKFWVQLCHLNRSNDAIMNENYDAVADISLNQVDIPDYIHMAMHEISNLEKCLNRSKIELESLNFINSSERQCQLLVNVFQMLTSKSQMGADTLVGLLIVTICRSKVLNLNSHLKYIEFFSYDNQNFGNGQLAYVLSTFNAVLEFFTDQKNLEVLKKHSLQNHEIWSQFEQSCDYMNTISEVQALLNRNNENENQLVESSIFSRNEDGQSLLSMAIRFGNFNVFKTIMDYEKIYPIEDILKDRNISNLSLLNQAILAGNQEIVYEIISIVLSSATKEEKLKYFNQLDDQQRNVGHILFEIDLLIEIGPYINWKQKDINHQTPFFALLRCYDHPQYEKLVETVIGIVSDWYRKMELKFDYRDHNDSKNNTLLHVIKCNVKLLLTTFENLNLNELNHKNLTPLMYYIKYNRLQNVRDILQDERLDLSKLDSKYYLSALDYAKIDIKSLIHSHEHSRAKKGVDFNTKGFHLYNKIIKDDKDNREIEQMVDEAFIQKFPIVENKTFGITRIKSDNVNHDLCLFFKTLIIDEQGAEKWITNIHNLKDFFKLLHLLKIENPHLLLATNYIDIIPVIPSETLKLNNFYKFQSQKLTAMLNMLCQLILNDFSQSQTLMDFLLKPGNMIPMDTMNRAENSLRVDKSSEKNLNNEFIEEEIGAMKHFLTYSLDQLIEFNKSLDSFIKILIFFNIKSEEVLVNHADAFSKFCLEENLVPPECFKISEDLNKIVLESSENAYDFDFTVGHKLIQCMCEELIETIKRVLVVKLTNWEEASRSVTKIDSEIQRLKSIDGKPGPQKQKLSRRLSNLNLSHGEDVTLQSTLPTSSSSTTSAGTSFDSFIFSSIVQTRKSRDLKVERLIEKKNAYCQKLEILGNELKKDHESVALKLNNFLGFKKDFLRRLFKNYTECVLRDLRFRQKLLEK